MVKKKNKKVSDAPKPIEIKSELSEPISSEPIPVDTVTSKEIISPSSVQATENKGSSLKRAAVVLLLFIAVVLAYYFFSMSDTMFNPGSGVDSETFKGIFGNSTNIFIVMDVRGAKDDTTSNNVLQCGVDFAASSGMSDKHVTPLSFGKDGCVAPDGNHPPKDCFSMLKTGLTIYVKDGPGDVKYYSNGMVVTIGQTYNTSSLAGSCGIRRV